MTVTVSAQEAQDQFAELLARVRREDTEIVIAENGVAVARLVPPPKPSHRRPPGIDAGKVRIAPDFNAPLPDDVLDAFEGR